MSESWQILRNAGVPLATPTTGPAPSEDVITRAAREAIASSPSGRDAEALAAWLLAWRAHWPTSFFRGFGTDAADVVAWAEGNSSLVDRYIKLRRIAVEHLATIL